jgi:hypothetical protein
LMSVSLPDNTSHAAVEDWYGHGETVEDRLKFHLSQEPFYSGEQLSMSVPQRPSSDYANTPKAPLDANSTIPQPGHFYAAWNAQPPTPHYQPKPMNFAFPPGHRKSHKLLSVSTPQPPSMIVASHAAPAPQVMELETWNQMYEVQATKDQESFSETDGVSNGEAIFEFSPRFALYSRSSSVRAYGATRLVNVSGLAQGSGTDSSHTDSSDFDFDPNIPMSKQTKQAHDQSNSSESKSRFNRCALLICFLILVCIATAVGAILGVKSSEHSSNSQHALGMSTGWPLPLPRPPLLLRPLSAPSLSRNRLSPPLPSPSPSLSLSLVV